MAKKKVNIKIMEFDKWLGSQGAFGQRGTYTAEDDIDGIMREAQKMKVQRIRTMELDKYLLQSEKELEKLKKGESLISDGGPMASNADFMKMARMMSDLSDEEQKRVANAYAVLRMADKGQVGGSLGLLGPLLGYARQNPGASEEQMIKYLTLMDSQFLKGLETAKVMNPNPAKSESEMVNYLKLMDSQLLKGLELAKAMNPTPKQDNPMEFLKLMKELVIEGVRNPVLQAIEKAQPTPGVFDQIMTNPDLWNRFKEIGLFGGSRGDIATSEMDLKIAQVTTANTLEMKKLELETQRMNLERDAQNRRTDSLLALAAPFSALFAGPIAQRMQSLGQQQASAHNPIGTTPMPMPNAILINCSCGYQGPISFDGPPPATVNCPKCGLELNVGDLPIAEKPEGADTGA